MPSTLKQSLQKLTKEKAPGPSPSFSTYHLLLAIELMADKSVGRNKLARELDIGQGAVRTLIGRLRDAGLITTLKSGCSLTDKGFRLWKEYRSTIKKIGIEKNELTFADHNVAVLVKNRGQKVQTGMEQRDAAVMAGAKSATTILFREGRLVFPSTIREVDKDFPKASAQIVKLLEPQENDAIVVVSSDSPRRAEYAALAAAWTLLDNN
jgi:DNA-binding MarR family transcriptional regulator